MALFSTVFTGISTATLSHHITKLDSQFSRFQGEVTDIRKDIVAIHEGVIHMFDDFSGQVQNRLTHLSCKFDNEIDQLAAAEIATRWEVKLDRIFRNPISGSIAGPLSPADISINHLKHLVKTHSELQQLLYADNAATLYGISEAGIVDATLANSTINLHILLHIPRISATNTFPLFALKQVGVYTANQDCAFIRHESYALKREGRIYELPQSLCDFGKKLATCRMVETSKLKESCLYNTTRFSYVRPNDCKSPRTIVVKSGILVSGYTQILAVNESINILEAKDKATFLEWSKYNKVQLDEWAFESPSSIREEVRDSNAQNDDLLHLRSAAESTFQQHRIEIKDRIRLTSQLTPTRKNGFPLSYEFIILINISVTLITQIIGAIIMVTCRRRHPDLPLPSWLRPCWRKTQPPNVEAESGSSEAHAEGTADEPTNINKKQKEMYPNITEIMRFKK